MKIVLLWLMSLVVLGAVASGWAFAQTRAADPSILSGSDFGFRLEGIARDGQPMGTIMVRVGDKWVEAGYSTPFERVK
jgi:hypothetical protein